MRRTNKTRYAILGMLSIGPMSGYDIKRALDESVANFWTENYGHIYPMLQQLLEAGLIEPVPAEPPRKVYALAAAGRDELLAWLEAEPEPQPPRNELILQLFFGDRLAAERMRGKIRAERERQRERQAVYARIRGAISLRPQEETRFWSMALRYGERVTEGILAWCDECLEGLELVAKCNQPEVDLQEIVRALAGPHTPDDVDLSPREAAALAALLEAEGRGEAWSQTDLQRTLGIDKSNVTRLAQRLRAGGQLEQEAAAEDGRLRRLRLTPSGRRTAERLAAASRERFAAVIERIDPGERPGVARALAVLVEAIRESDRA